MYNKDILNKIYELNEIYEYTWGQRVDNTVIPTGMTQERLVKVLELMIETNDSMLVAYNKLYGSKGCK